MVVAGGVLPNRNTVVTTIANESFGDFCRCDASGTSTKHHRFWCGLWTVRLYFPFVTLGRTGLGFHNRPL